MFWLACGFVLQIIHCHVPTPRAQIQNNVCIFTWNSREVYRFCLDLELISTAPKMQSESTFICCRIACIILRHASFARRFLGNYLTRSEFRIIIVNDLKIRERKYKSSTISWLLIFGFTTKLLRLSSDFDGRNLNFSGKKS